MTSVLPLSVLFILFLVATNGKRNFEIFFENFSCTVSPIYGTVLDCYINKSTTPPMGYVNIQVHHQITEPRYGFDVLLIKNNQERYSLFNSHNNDGCGFLVGKIQPTLIQILKKSLLNYGELPDKCPIRKDFHLQLKNIRIDPDYFPAYMPEAKFVIQINISELQEMLYFFEANGEIKQKKKRWFG